MEFKFPDVGEGISEGEIVKWHVTVGDRVTVDQVLVEVETDKAIVEIPSPYPGNIVALYGKVGDVIHVGDTLVTFAETAVPEHGSGTGVVGVLEEAAPVSFQKSSSLVKKESSARSDLAVPDVSPRARQLAHELGVDLSLVKGTGASGVITETDVHAAVSPISFSPVKVQRKYDFYGYVERQPLSGVRKATAEHMISSWQVPHVTHMDWIDVTDLVALREKEKGKLAVEEVHLTYLPFIILACCRALNAYPALNATLIDREIIVKKYCNIGVAMQTEQGLFVPIVKGADKKSITALAVELATLQAKTQERTLDPMDLKGGTFTITNVGTVSGVHFTPILYDGQSAILGLGRISQQPVYLDGRVLVRSLLPVSVSFDHRVVDGYTVASFVVALRKYLSDPSLLLLE